MHIPGHLSVGYLMASAHGRLRGRTPYLYTETLPLLLGTLTPDIIDKSLLYLEVTSHGRTVGHSLFTLVGLVAAWLVIGKLKATVGGVMGFWILGIFAHHITDVVDDFVRGVLHGRQLISSWFLWPAVDQDHWRWLFWGYFKEYRFSVALEVAVVFVAILAAWSDWRRRKMV